MFSESYYTKKGVQPPHVKQIAHTSTHHGQSWQDPYFWLRERDNPEVLSCLQAENAYTEQVMADTNLLQKKLYQEMVGRLREDDASVPVKDGDYWYYTRAEKGQQYPLHCRRHGGRDAPEEIILDENLCAAKHSFFHLGIFHVSPDHTLLAYAIDTTGGEEYALYFTRIGTGESARTPIALVSDFEWADNQRFMLTTMDATRRATKIYHGALAGGLELVYEEQDPLFYLDLAKSKDDAYIFPSRTSKDTTEVWLVPAAAPETPPRSIYGCRQNVHYLVDAREETLYLIEYGSTPHGRLLSLPVADLATQAWKECIAESRTRILEDMECFRDYIVLFERMQGVQQLAIFDPCTGVRAPLPFEEPLRAITEAANYEYASDTFRIVYSSFVTPAQVREYHYQTGTYTVLKEQFVGEQFAASQYAQERIVARAKDGTKIPVSLVYRRELFRKDGTNPMFLYGYGAYGIMYDPIFSAAGLSLLDRGFVFALAHIRGGGEFGRPWYEAGKLANKMNTFTDFIACMEHVTQEGYTTGSKLTIGGRSAGGLLMGAVVTMRPDLFRAALVGVPAVDLINTMMDPTLTSTTLEYEEWGNPHNPVDFARMQSYSPYDNVQPQNYPTLLVTAGINDPLVNYWEPAKWVAKLRSMKTDDNVLMLQINMGAGHHGSLGRYMALEQEAFEYAFLITAVAGGNGEA